MKRNRKIKQKKKEDKKEINRTNEGELLFFILVGQAYKDFNYQNLNNNKYKKNFDFHEPNK